MGYDPQRHGPIRVVGPGFHERVYAAVCRVPPGRVTTYGDVAAALGLRSAARQVGYALAALPASRRDVPWHRVVNHAGRISLRAGGEPSAEQRRRLAREGVRVGNSGVVVGFRAIRVAPPAR
jgi:methylated-DNA-protein-cysteine methyltransferase-like protein